MARAIIDRCFNSGLLIEASGADDEVLKVMPALTAEPDLVREGLDILTASVEQAVEDLSEADLGGPIALETVPAPLDFGSLADAGLGNLPGASL